MSKGFLGLGGTGVGNFVSNIWDGAKSVVENSGDFVASLPNQTRDFADQLANIIYGGAQDINQQVQNSDYTKNMQNNAEKYYYRQAGDQAGQAAYNAAQKSQGILGNKNVLLLIGGAIIVAILAKG